MSFRATLSGLDDAALEAVASKGLVRRAHRDHEAGLAAVLQETTDGAALKVDGESVTLGQGGLVGARCTCPAQGLCRHILAAVIAMRGASETPAEASASSQAAMPEPALDPTLDPLAEIAAFSAADLVKAFGRSALRDAEIILAAMSDMIEQVEIETTGRTCRVSLPGQPEVRYLAGLGLAGMIAKAPAPVAVAGKAETTSKRKPMSTKALQAAAVLVVRRRQAGDAIVPAPAAEPADAPVAAPMADPPDDADFLDAVTEALAEAARAGLASAPVLLEERLLDLALSSRADALPRLAGALRGIAEDLSERRARAATFEPAAALAAIAKAYALVLALRGAGADPILRGAIRQPYVDRGTLTIVGCGIDLWRMPTGARGATAYGLVLHAEEPQDNRLPWLTMTLARAAGQDPFFVPRQAVRAEPVWGTSLERLAHAAFRLEGARATAMDGRLSLASDTRMSLGGETLAEALATRLDLLVEDWSAIEGHLAAWFSPSLRSTVRGVPLLLKPSVVAPVQFDAIEQRAWLPVMDRSGVWLDLTIGGDDDTRLDAIVALQAKDVPRAIVVIATRDSGAITLSPIAALTQDADALQSFDFWEPPRPIATSQVGLGRTMLDRLKSGFEGLGVLGARPRAAVFASALRPDAAAMLLARATDEALALAELGGRMQDPARLDLLARLATELDTAGLAALASLLSQLARASTRERPLRLLAFIHAAACQAALTARLPFVQRVA